MKPLFVLLGSLCLAACATLPKSSGDGSSIGTAMMAPDGTITLHLRAGDAGALGDGALTYSPDHPQYREVAEHLDGLAPGETKSVPPWPDE